MYTFFYNTLVVFIITILLLNIPNKSNFPKQIIIPIISGLFAKYTIGDFDINFKWTFSDIFYWFWLFSFSYFIIYIF